MPSSFVRSPQGRRCLQGTALAASLDALAAHLQERGHAPSTIAMYGRAASHFARWLLQRKTPLAGVDDRTIQRFLDRHLARCRCSAPGPSARFTVRAAVHHFLTVLRRDGRVPQPASTVPPAIALAVGSYDTYLRDTCGLAEATRIYRRRYVREFLEATFDDRPIVAAELRPVDVERFVTTRARRYRPGSAQVLASSIRSWFRYQQLVGACDVRLLASVPRIPRWRLATIPTALSDDDVQCLLDSIDRTTPTGRRDYAMARCLVDLGLRASEVAHLRLEDVDWREGRLRISGTKNRRADWLPLPRSVGLAIAAYLRRGRPRTTARALFVRHHVPVGAPIRSSVVRQALHRAAVAADLGGRWRGPHALRHYADSWIMPRSAEISRRTAGVGESRSA